MFKICSSTEDSDLYEDQVNELVFFLLYFSTHFIKRLKLFLISTSFFFFLFVLTQSKKSYLEYKKST